MRRLVAILLVALLAVNSFPLATQARLICRMTGMAMQPIAVQDDPRSCCAIQEGSSGKTELANRSCCDLKITPGHAPLPNATFAHIATAVAILPTIPVGVSIPNLIELAPVVTLVGVPQYRGPPPASASPRAPPIFS